MLNDKKSKTATVATEKMTEETEQHKMIQRSPTKVHQFH